MKALIWIGGYFAMTLVYTLTYGILPTNGFVSWLESVIYLVIWIIASVVLCRKWDIRVVKKEAQKKGLSTEQYITEIVPHDLIEFCETNKGNPSAIRTHLANCARNGIIKRYVVSYLVEFYK